MPRQRLLHQVLTIENDFAIKILSFLYENLSALLFYSDFKNGVFFGDGDRAWRWRQTFYATL